MFPIAVALAQGYHTYNPQAQFRITADGTARGIKYASEGMVVGLSGPLMAHSFSIPDGNTGPTMNGEAVDLGIASRDLLPDERENYTLSIATVVCIDGLAVAVNPDVTVNNLTIAQVRDIYAGRVTNWSTVGGPDLTIQVIVRDPISGTAGAWNDLVMHGTPLVGGTISVAYNPDVTATIAMHPGSIGYLSFNYLAPTVHPLSIEGVAPTIPNLASQQYPIRRPFVFVTVPTSSALTRDFVRWTLTPAGVAVLEANGEVPPESDGGAP